MDLSGLRLDLNLLKALYILLEERSVTRAATRLFITQSAMSKTLHRLRVALDDQLFVRSPQGLLPTVRAEELIVPLRKLFEQVDVCLRRTYFDPNTACGKIRIASPEQFALGAIPSLILGLRRAAPHLQLDLLPLMDDHLESLGSGAIDFVICLDQPVPAGFEALRIFSAAPMMWCRTDHPLAEKPIIALQDIFSYPHISFHSQNVAINDLQAIEMAIQEAGLPHEVVLDTCHLLVAFEVLLQTDSLILAPEYLFRVPTFQQNLVQRTISHIPVFEHMKIDLVLIQHERTKKSPLYEWLTGEIEEAFCK